MSSDTHIHTQKLVRQAHLPLAISSKRICRWLCPVDALCCYAASGPGCNVGDPAYVGYKTKAFDWVMSLKALLFNVTVTVQGLCLAARYNPDCLAMCRCVFSVLLCITLAIHRRTGLYLQVFCSKVSPNCGACPLQASCEYALNNGKRLQPQAVKPSSARRQVGCTFSTDSNALNRPQPV